ncbi:unnamed protein product [Prorocentrum cordatum]|uniref:Leucine-rich repeat-containing protein 40 n=1 Tax=Prorocentrum cordatum TaxID=2364126 RepID=A0ABN9WAK9_9DINO|nr:unnamed protein product [Polarella glacialis]
MAGRGRLQRNERFFGQAAASASGDAGAEAKVRRAFQRCAESGVLNLSGQNLKGDLPASICGFQERNHGLRTGGSSIPSPRSTSPTTRSSVSRPRSAGLRSAPRSWPCRTPCRRLPAELFTELPLKQLNFRQNQLVALPPGEALACAEQLVELVLSENQLSCLPAELFDLPSLEVLEVSGNSVAGLSDHEWGCSRLRRLDLSQNALGPRLPSRGLHRCSVLRELSLAGNTLEELGETFVLPPQHAWRTSLVSLDLSANRLGPSLRISGLEALDCLQVSSNRISSLELGGRFPRLSALVAQSNQISEFPAALLPDTAPNLATLDLMNNDLNSLPPELGLNQALKRIQLAGNPIRRPSRRSCSGAAPRTSRGSSAAASRAASAGPRRPPPRRTARRCCCARRPRVAS